MRVKSIGFVTSSYLGVVLLDHNDPAGPESRGATLKEADEVLVGEMPHAPLDPDDVVALRLGMEALQGLREEADTPVAVRAREGAGGGKQLLGLANEVLHRLHRVGGVAP